MTFAILFLLAIIGAAGWVFSRIYAAVRWLARRRRTTDGLPAATARAVRRDRRASRLNLDAVLARKPNRYRN